MIIYNEDEQFFQNCLFYRCREWVQASGNIKLLNINPVLLHNHYYLCEEHFNNGQFNSKNVTLLKTCAIPTLFDSPSLTEDMMQLYDFGWNIKQMAQGVPILSDLFKKIINVSMVSNFNHKLRDMLCDSIFWYILITLFWRMTSH